MTRHGRLARGLLALLLLLGPPAPGGAVEPPVAGASALGLRPTADPGAMLCVYASAADAATRRDCHGLEGGPGWYARADRLLVLDETDTAWRVSTPPEPSDASGGPAAPARPSPAEAERMVAGLAGRVDPAVVALVRAELLAGATPRTAVRALQQARPDVFGPAILSALCAAAPARCVSEAPAPTTTAPTAAPSLAPASTPERVPAVGYVRKGDPAAVLEVRMRPPALDAWRALLRPLVAVPDDGSRLALIAGLLDGLQQALGLRVDSRAPDHLGELVQRATGLPGAAVSPLLDRSLRELADPHGHGPCGGARVLLQRAKVAARLLDLVAAGARGPVFAPAPPVLAGCGTAGEHDRPLAPLPELTGSAPLGPDASYSYRHASAAGVVYWVPAAFLP